MAIPFGRGTTFRVSSGGEPNVAPVSSWQLSKSPLSREGVAVMPAPPITRVVLYKHGVGHFEREGPVEGDATLALTFRQAEVSDVLKSLTVLDLDGGHVASVSYDSTKPLEQLLADVALSIPDSGSLVGLLPQIKGARVAVVAADQRTEGALLGLDTSEREVGPGKTVKAALVSLLTDEGGVRTFDLFGLTRLEVLDAA